MRKGHLSRSYQIWEILDFKYRAFRNSDCPDYHCAWTAWSGPCLLTQENMRIFLCSVTPKCHWNVIHVLCHAKTCLRAYSDSECQDQPAHPHAVWSGHSLSANRIIEHIRMYQWRAVIRMIICACMGWICAFCACSKAIFCLARPTCIIV